MSEALELADGAVAAAALAGDKQVIAIELGLTGKRNPQ